MQIPPSYPLARILKARAANRALPPSPQSSQAAPTPATLAPNVTAIPARLRELEPAEPLLLLIDDPVFNTPDAALILGVTADRLIKWRQRRQGPAYLQYENNGPVRYELSALIEFKAAYRVRPSRQPHPGRRR